MSALIRPVDIRRNMISWNFPLDDTTFTTISLADPVFFYNSLAGSRPLHLLHLPPTLLHLQLL